MQAWKAPADYKLGVNRAGIKTCVTTVPELSIALCTIWDCQTSFYLEWRTDTFTWLSSIPVRQELFQTVSLSACRNYLFYRNFFPTWVNGLHRDFFNFLSDMTGAWVVSCLDGHYLALAFLRSKSGELANFSIYSLMKRCLVSVILKPTWARVRWMSQRANKRMNERTNQRTNESLNHRVIELLNQWTS